MSKLNIAVIGYGHLGKWHCQKAESFGELATLKYIVEKFEAGRELAIKNHPNVKVVDDISKCINDIDAAIVVTPTSFHFEIVDYLLTHNKHVFCEKPVTETLEQALKLKHNLENKNLVLQIGHSERFHNAWEMKENYKDYFKAPAHITLKRVAPFKGRATDVDVVQDLMIHDLDLLVFLFKETPTAVDAVGYKMRTNKYDYVSANFKFESGHRATITVGRNQTKEVRELEISNTTGTLLVDLMKNEIIEARGSFDGPEFTKTIPYEKRDHLLIEHKHFYESILFKKAPIVSIEDGILAVKLIEKVLESADKHREVTL
jgi:predicted dehydrogenase